jgi:hypothetical protein
MTNIGRSADLPKGDPGILRNPQTWGFIVCAFSTAEFAIELAIFNEIVDCDLAAFFDKAYPVS